MSWGLVGIAAGSAAIACGVISVASWRALLRTGNAAISYFVIAFALLGAKNALKSYLSVSGFPSTELIEGAFSLVDLVAVALVAWPLVARRGPG